MLPRVVKEDGLSGYFFAARAQNSAFVIGSNFLAGDGEIDFANGSAGSDFDVGNEFHISRGIQQDGSRSR